MPNMASMLIQKIVKTSSIIMEHINIAKRDSQNKQKHATFILMKYSQQQYMSRTDWKNTDVRKSTNCQKGANFCLFCSNIL